MIIKQLIIVTIAFVGTLPLSDEVAPPGHPKVSKTKSVEKDLIQMLLNRYEKFGLVGRPVNDSRIQVTVRFGLQLFQILDLDENKQILHTNCWNMYKWNDSLLEWNVTEYANVKVVRIFPDQIWTPDIKLYNFADERLKEQKVARVVVSSDGSTLWVPQALYKSTCEVEITYFPFDTQVCMMEFGSWTYDVTQMDVQWWIPANTANTANTSMPYLDFSDYVPSNGWVTDGEKERNVPHPDRVIQLRSVKKYRTRVQRVGGEMITRRYPVLRYLVKLDRNPSFYLFMLVIPCVLLSLLTMVVFCLPPESPAKMMLGMNIFVAFFVLLLLLAESTPSAVRNFPLIGVFFCLNMVMITLSTFFATAVIHFYFRGDRTGTMPPILRRYVIDGIGRLTGVRQQIPLPEVKPSNTHVVTRSASGKVRRKVHVPELTSNKFLMTDPSTTCMAMCSAPQGRLANSVSGHFFPGGCVGAGDDETGHGGHYTGCFGAGGYPAGVPYATQPTGPHEMPGMMNPPCGAPHTHCIPQGMRNHACLHKSVTGEDFLPGGGSNGMGAVDSEDSPIMLSSSTSLERDVRELKRYVRTFVNRQKEKSRKELLSMEWRTFALVLDRLFLMIYIIVILIAIIVLTPRSTELKLPDAFLNSEE